MDYTSVVDQCSKEYEKENGEPASDSAKKLFRAISGLMATAYEDGVRAGIEKAKAAKG